MLRYVRMIASVVNSAISNGAVAHQKMNFGPAAMKSQPERLSLLQKLNQYLLGETSNPGGGIHLTCPLTREESREALKSLHQAA